MDLTFYLEIKCPLQIWNLIFPATIAKQNDSLPEKVLLKQMLPEHKKCKASSHLSWRI